MCFKIIVSIILITEYKTITKPTALVAKKAPLIGFIINMIAATINKSTQDLFVVVFSSSVLPGMIPWFVILLAELKFRRNNQDLLVDHPFKLPLYPISNYFAFLMLIVIVIFMLINPETRVSVLVGAAVLLIATIVYLFRHKKDGVNNGE